MTGYSRVFSKSTNDTIQAADFNNEYQSLEDAFVVASGHKHDGTAGEGAYVPTISGASNRNAVEVDEANDVIEFFIDVATTKVQQANLGDGYFAPETDSDFDLGTVTKAFKDIYVDTVKNATMDTCTIDGGTF